jgi:hypothetical protein
MSGGRLVILPKKSYCPWKPENIERVLRDERLESERQEKESQLCRVVAENHHSTSRLSKLRQLKQTKATAITAENTVTTNPTTTLQIKEESNPKNIRMQHVNLFQKEEEESADGSLVEGSQANKAAVGIMPVMLGQSELQARGDNLPFYLRAQSLFDRYSSDHAHILCPKEESRKNNLDPMKYFIDTTIQTPAIDVVKSHDTESISSESSRKRRRRKHRSHHEKKKHSKKVRRHEDGRDKKSKRSDHKDPHDESQKKSMSPKKTSSTTRDDHRRVEKLQERRQLQHNSRENPTK